MRKLLMVVPLLAALILSPAATGAPPKLVAVPRSEPIAVPIVQTIPDAADVAYPGGTITLDIDASDVQRGTFRVSETIPLVAGARDLTLLYPRWLPGHHAPRGSPSELVAMSFSVAGKVADWLRDPVEVNAYHVTLPPGARELVAKFVYTSPLQTSEGRVVMTQEMLNLQWEQMSLYPAGYYVRRIKVKPSVTVPQGWTTFTALDGQAANGNRLSWAETDYATLVDSPIFAGMYARRWDLGNGIRLNAVADKPELLTLPPERLPALKAMGDEALILFGSRHFDRYEFLVALTDRMGGIGLEHHRSSENQLGPKNFVEWDKFDWDRNVLPHELSHSWDGKFRRPAKLWTPDYRQPMQDNLLWVYEGQDQFWGLVLAARSGVQSKETVLGMLAALAGNYATQPGRSWRSVEDTTFDPIINARKPRPYRTMSRDEDYYNEGALIWLEADQIIRAGTAGRKGLDDFARGFFGIRDGDWGEVTYEFVDVVAALNAVYPYDWGTFLKTRIEASGQPPPLAGIEKAGYHLVWKDEPNMFDKARMEDGHNLPLTYSLGITLDKDGAVSNPRWDSPAFNAGVVTGAKVIAVNGLAYDADGLKAAIIAAKGGSKSIELLIKRGDRFQTVPVAWNGGLRYPWLERVPGSRGQAGLDVLLSPRRTSGQVK
jgi:predicted metalloprotease with PDZ domain